MTRHRIRKGLDLPIEGAPSREIDRGRRPHRVALMGRDYVGMKPTMHVEPGDNVRRGQLVMEDKKRPGVRFTAPASGRVAAIHRGHRRAFLALVIELDRDELEGRGASRQRFSSFDGTHPDGMSRQRVRELLVESGEWTALRTRPFSRTPFVDSTPDAIFVTATDTNPLAPDVDAILEGGEADFRRGIDVMLRLTDGPVYVCTGPDPSFELPEDDRLRLARFQGPHPAGTAGLHIHRLHPAHRHRTVWHIGMQDTVAVGHLFRTGELMVERTVALGGPPVRRPRLLRTRVGAATDDLVAGELEEGELRVISGSVLSGRTAMGEETGYLGRFHQQISVLREDRERRLFGWLAPGLDRFSVMPAFASALLPRREFDLTTSTHGSERAIVPIGTYEKVMPLDLMATQLMRALIMRDAEVAEKLGCLELDEEDVALATFVCPGKNDYGPMLREVLTTIEKEG